MAQDDLASLFSANPQQYAAAYGQALLQAGRAKEAVQALSKLHAASPLLGPARVVLGQAYFDSMDVASAEALVAQDRKLFEADAAGLRLLAELQLEKGQKSEAISTLKSAYAANSRDVRTQELLVMLGQLKASDLQPAATASQIDGDDDFAHAGATVAENARRLKSTLTKAGMTAAVMVLFLSGYAWRVRVESRVQKLVTEAKGDRQKNDYAALLRAEKKYHEALDGLSSHKGALSGLAEVEAFLVLEHKHEGGVSALTDIAKRVVSKDLASGERFLAQAASLIVAGTPAVADQLLEKTIRDGGVDSRVLYAAGLSQLMIGKFQTAKDSLRKAYEMDPFHPAIAATVGDVFLIEGDLKNADFYYRKAVDANPDHVRAASRALLSRILSGEELASVAGKIAELEEKAKTTSPSHQQAVALLSAVADPNGTAAKAKAVALLGASKEDPASQAALSWWLLSVGDPQGQAGLESLAKRFAPLPRVTMELARIAARQTRPEDGEAKIAADKELLESPKGQAFVGHLYMNAGNAKVAADWFGKALKQDEKTVEAIFGMGRVSHAKKAWAEALPLYARAIELRPTYGDVYEQVANVYVENKEYDNARANYLQAEKLWRSQGVEAARLNALYEAVAKTFEKQGGADSKAQATKWRSKIKK